jgi:hypothetical protein
MYMHIYLGVAVLVDSELGLTRFGLTWHADGARRAARAMVAVTPAGGSGGGSGGGHKKKRRRGGS